MLLHYLTFSVFRLGTHENNETKHLPILHAIIFNIDYRRGLYFNNSSGNWLPSGLQKRPIGILVHSI